MGEIRLYYWNHTLDWKNITTQEKTYLFYKFMEKNIVMLYFLLTLDKSNVLF